MGGRAVLRVRGRRLPVKGSSLTIGDIDLVEVNEAFSSIPLAWAKALTGGDLTKVTR